MRLLAGHPLFWGEACLSAKLTKTIVPLRGVWSFQKLVCLMPAKPKRTRSSRGRKPFAKRHKPHAYRLQPPPLETDTLWPMRLNKYVAHCGIAARRQAAELVKKGLVKVNGEVVDNPAYQVQPGDVVQYRGRVIEPETRKVYILMNKPKGVITTVLDEKGRKTVMDLLGDQVQARIFPVGRLDRDTTGLLLLTNDGELAQKLMHPSKRVRKVYHVVLEKPLAAVDLDRIRRGIELEDGLVQVDEIDYVAGRSKNELGIILHSGRNRVIRRIFEHLGYEVKKLDRTWLAGLNKRGLRRGQWRYLTEREIVMLKHFV